MAYVRGMIRENLLLPKADLVRMGQKFKWRAPLEKRWRMCHGRQCYITIIVSLLCPNPKDDGGTVFLGVWSADGRYIPNNFINKCEINIS